MDLIQQEFQSLSAEDQEMLVENPIMRDMFSETWSKEFRLPLEEVSASISQIIAKREGDVAAVFTPKVVVKEVSPQGTYYELMSWHERDIVNPLCEALWRRSVVEGGVSYEESQSLSPSTEDLEPFRRQVFQIIRNSPLSPPRPPELIYGLSTRAQERRAKLLRSFSRVLGQNKDGLSKTQLLTMLNKDNGSWRGVADEVLEYMLQTGKAIKTGTIYYSTNHAPIERENSYHRLVYEYLSTHGPCSVSTILSHMGYNNSKGRQKMRQILQQLQDEGFVSSEGRKWKVC